MILVAKVDTGFWHGTPVGAICLRQRFLRPTLQNLILGHGKKMENKKQGKEKRRNVKDDKKGKGAIRFSKERKGV